MENIKTAWEQTETHLNSQLELITQDGESLRIYLHTLGLNPQKETTWESVVGLANFILHHKEREWESFFTEDGLEALDRVWNTDYHNSIMGKALDFLELQWVFYNIHGLHIYSMETIILWGILYLGEEG